MSRRARRTPSSAKRSSSGAGRRSRLIEDDDGDEATGGRGEASLIVVDDADEDSVRLTESSIKRGLIANATARGRVGEDSSLRPTDDGENGDGLIDNDDNDNEDDQNDVSWLERRRRQRLREDRRSNGNDDDDDYDNDNREEARKAGHDSAVVDDDRGSEDAGTTASRDDRVRERAIVVRHRSSVAKATSSSLSSSSQLPKVRGGRVTSFAERATLAADGSLQRGGCNNADEGFVPPWVAFHVRAYLDVLFGAVTLEKIRLVKLRNRRSEFAVPNVVDSILRYNNIAFAAVEMCWVNGTQLVEPIWYDIDAFNNRLQLYISQSMYDAFCARQSDDPVNMASGVVPIENYDPYATSPEASGPLDKATVNCAIACDHVAQHIIVEVLRPGRASPGADIHDRFTEVGCTLHSMLDVTAVTAREAGRCLGLGGDDAYGTRTVRDTSSYLTLLDNNAADWRAAGARRANAAATASLYGSSCPFDTSTGAYGDDFGAGDLLRPVAYGDDGGYFGGGALLDADGSSRFGGGGGGSYAFEETIA